MTTATVGEPADWFDMLGSFKSDDFEILPSQLQLSA
jgi:hypothetical protein